MKKKEVEEKQTRKKIQMILNGKERQIKHFNCFFVCLVHSR